MLAAVHLLAPPMCLRCCLKLPVALSRMIMQANVMKTKVAFALAAVLLINAAAAQTTSSMTFCAGAEGPYAFLFALTSFV